MKDNNTRTAGIIVIGNEILSGKVQDVNSFYLTSELRTLGIEVRRVSVIPDEVELIGNEVVEFSAEYDYVFTTGGVGPTHDDVTMAGIARGFEVKLVRHPEIKRFLSLKYNNFLNDAVLKMAEVPEGSEVMILKNAQFPIVSFKNVFIFPGIPQYLKNKFPLIKERFRSRPFYVRRVFLDAHESDIAGVLSKAVAKNREVSFGSYPVVDNPEYRVVVTVESKEESYVEKALDELLKKLSDKIVVRLE